MLIGNLLYLSSGEGSSLIGNHLFPGSNSFPFWVNPLSEGVWFATKQTGSHKNNLSRKPWRKIYLVYPVLLTFEALFQTIAISQTYFLISNDRETKEQKSFNQLMI